MRQDNTESLFFLGAGPLAAILLGAALVPLRGITPAANLSFAFMALTILVAEHGGRWAAVATALCSALSLDFFLTQPYLRLTISDKHDLVAFVGLAACGLIASALGSQRGERVAALRAAQKQLDMLDTAIGGLESSEPLESRLGKILDAVRIACPITRAVVRDELDRVLAATEDVQAAMHVPVPGRRIANAAAAGIQCRGSLAAEPSPSLGRSTPAARRWQPAIRLAGPVGKRCAGQHTVTPLSLQRRMCHGSPVGGSGLNP